MRFGRTMGRVALALAAPALFTVPAAPALAGEYVLAQCDRDHRGYDHARFDRTTGAYYGFTRGCNSAGQGNALRINDLASAPVGAEGRISFLAPAGTGVTGVTVDASLRSDAGHSSRLSFLDSAGNQNGRVGTGPDAPGGFQRYSHRLDGVGRAGFAALLVCARARPCPASEQARAGIRNVRVRLRDRVAPTVAPAGDLLGGGWVRGARGLAVSASDTGGGIRAIEVRAGGGSAGIPPSRTLRCATVGSGSLVSAPVPCPRSANAAATIDTGRAPFVNGANPLTVCAVDYGSSPNRTCVTKTVRVDNLPPTGSFRTVSRQDPELIAADLGDAHSGLTYVGIAYRPMSGGEWTDLPTEAIRGGYGARVDSEALPAGRYEFRLVAVDRAGNIAVLSRARDGRPMVLDFPLREATRLSARIAALGHRVRYGAPPKLVGRLRTQRNGVEGRTVVITERFEPGARPQVRRRTIRTGAGGRFSARLSQGPSRKVVASFAGGRRLLGSASRERKLAVKGKVSLRASRRSVAAGKRVRFRGKVGARGVRIPAPGKVVELQVRERGERRYRTVGKALHSGRRGTVKTSYRFGRFYRSPVTFQFRLKVTRQARWPYRAPTVSRPRALTVKPRG